MKNIIHIIDNYFDLSNTINEKITAGLIDEAKSNFIQFQKQSTNTIQNMYDNFHSNLNSNILTQHKENIKINFKHLITYISNITFNHISNSTFINTFISIRKHIINNTNFNDKSDIKHISPLGYIKN